MGVNVAAAVDLVQKWIPVRSGRRPRVAQRSPHSITRVLAILSLTIAAGCVLSSCGGGSGSTTVTGVTISPTSITVPLNTQTTFTAVVNLANSTVSTTTTVTWEVNGISGGDSGVGTIPSDP